MLSVELRELLSADFVLPFVEVVFDFLCEPEEPGCDLDVVFEDIFELFALAFLKLCKGLFLLLDIRAELVLSLFFLLAERDEGRGTISSSLDIKP